MDIRTGAVSGSKIRKKIYNDVIKHSCKLFNETTIISESLAKELKINRYHVVPLGGEPMVHKCEIENSLNELNFLYVGIFDGRNIDVVIHSFIKFYKEYSQRINTKLTIVGYSNNPNIALELKELININSEVAIKYVGRVPNKELKKFFADSNVGISYIPITPWFDIQPPTKTYEYIINGLVCIATNTSENRKVINSNNGIIINDDIESVYAGMCNIFNNRSSYRRHQVITESEKYSWKNIYESYIKNILNYESKIR